MRGPLLTATLLLVLCQASLAAEVYKWVDANGAIHFGSEPPADQPSSKVNTRTQPAPANNNLPQPSSLPTLDSQQGERDQAEIDAQVRRELAKNEAQRREYCGTIRTNLSQLRNNPRVRMEQKGEVRRLGEDERQAMIRETETKIAQNCD